MMLLAVGSLLMQDGHIMGTVHDTHCRWSCNCLGGMLVMDVDGHVMSGF